MWAGNLALPALAATIRNWLRGEFEYVDLPLFVVYEFDCNPLPGGTIGDIRAECCVIHQPHKLAMKDLTRLGDC